MHSPDIEIDKLKHQLNLYVDNAKHNEEKLRRFQLQELQFIKASGLKELLDAFFVDYRHRFNLDSVGLLLVDENYEIRRILGNLNIEIDHYPQLLFTDSSDILTEIFGKRFQPLLGCKHSKCYETLFTNQFQRPASIAALPLIRQGRAIGSFNVGSVKVRRYSEQTATDFLKRLVEIFAVCFENAINNEKVKLLGLIDPLTGIHNRRYFDQRLTEEVSNTLRQNQPLSCLFLDIDHFKSFNDTYGHQIGDLVLQEVAVLIKSQMRLSDVIARFGGEEFSILLPNTDTTGAMEIAERVRYKVANHPLYANDKEHLHVTLSTGCSTIKRDHPNQTSDKLGQHLVYTADAALYEAKQQGRNRVNYQEFNAEETEASLDQSVTESGKNTPFVLS